MTAGRLGLVERAELAVSGYLAEHRVPVRDLRVRLLGEVGFRVELDPEALDGISGPGCWLGSWQRVCVGRVTWRATTLVTQRLSAGWRRRSRPRYGGA